MKTFSYRGFATDGRASRGLVEALDLKDARERLTTRGVFAEHIAAVGGDGAAKASATKLSTPDRSRLYEELAALLKAGLPLADALESTLRGTRNTRIATLLAGVRDRVREGQSFGEAMDAAGGSMSGYERAMLDAGVRGGSLPECLERLGNYFDGQHRAAERLRSALVYPAIVLGLSVVIAAGMFGVVLPTLSTLFAESRMDLPWATRLLMGAGVWVGRWGLVAVLLLGVVGWLAMARARGKSELLLRWDRRTFSLPVIGALLRSLASARFAGTLSMLSRGGVPLVEAFTLAGAATGSRWLAALAAEGAERIRHGDPMSSVVATMPPLAEGLPEWIQAGETSGDVPGLLDKAAARFEVQWQHALARCVGMIEPLLIILVGVFVLFVALAILLPILSLNRTLM